MRAWVGGRRLGVLEGCVKLGGGGGVRGEVGLGGGRGGECRRQYRK